MFTHLHWHSHYSLLEAIGEPWKIVDITKKLWMKSIAITDYYWLYWAIEFFEEATKKWIKPIIWVELSIVEDINKIEEKQNPQNIVLLAKNYKWYENLLKIVSASNLKWFNELPRTDFKILWENKEWIIWFMWGENSFIGKMILAWEKNKKTEEFIQKNKEILDWNFFLELIAQDESKQKELKKINQNIVEIWKNTNTKIIVNNEYSYPEKADKEAYEVLLCIKENSKFTKSFLNGKYHIMTEEEIQKVLEKNWYDKKFIEEIIKNNQEVDSLIDLQIPLWDILFPKYDNPDYIKKLFKENKDFLIEKTN